MATIKVYNMKAEETGVMEVSDALFQMDYNEALIHQAVVTRLANERQGTKSTLTRTEVRGGGRKPFRQKGTGNARQGSIRAPQFIKGGVVFAPKSRDFSKKMNAKAKKVPLFSALSQKIRDDEVFFIDEIKVEAPKTKEMATFLKTFGIEKTALIVMDNNDDAVIRACANIAALTTLNVNQISVYEIVKNATIVISRKAAEQIKEVYGE